MFVGYVKIVGCVLGFFVINIVCLLVKFLYELLIIVVCVI